MKKLLFMLIFLLTGFVWAMSESGTTVSSSVDDAYATHFRNAYWQCYDGVDVHTGSSTSCKSSAQWKDIARDYCANHCYEDGSKC